jgi:hypothetical protein
VSYSVIFLLLIQLLRKINCMQFVLMGEKRHIKEFSEMRLSETSG